MTTTNISALQDSDTFTIWKDKTNALITHAAKAVTLGSTSENNDGNINLNGDIILESGHSITVDTITAVNANEIELLRNLRIDRAGASTLQFSLNDSDSWSIETNAGHSTLQIRNNSNNEYLQFAAGAITSSGLTLNKALLPSSIDADTTGNAATATQATKVTVTDKSDNTDYPVVFHDEAAASGLLDDTGVFEYNPSTGTITTTKLTATGAVTAASLDINGNADVSGNLGVSGTLTANLTGNASGQAGTLSSSGIQAILEKIYPVDSIYITAKNENPNTTLGFGTWVAYAEGRAIVGSDETGIAITAGSRDSNNVVTLTLDVSGLLDSKHPIAVGDKVTVTGIGTSQDNPNANSVTVKAIANGTISYDSTGQSETFGGFTSAVVKQDAFTFGDQGGSTGHKLTVGQLPAHTHNHATGASGNSTNPTFSSGKFRGFSGMNSDVTLFSSEISDPNGVNIKKTGSDEMHSNLQPYISTYVWRRSI
jgi:hypothetical protein